MKTYTISGKDLQVIKNAQELLSLVKLEYDQQFKIKKLTISDTRYREYILKLKDLTELIERLKGGK